MFYHLGNILLPEIAEKCRKAPLWTADKSRPETIRHTAKHPEYI